MEEFKERLYIKDAIGRTGSVKIAGWISDIRILKSISFIVIRDATGELQVIVPQELSGELQKLTKESVVVIRGKMQKSKIARSGVELIAKEISPVSIAEQPVPLDTSGKIDSGIEARINWRFLDLRLPQHRAIFRIQSRIMKLFQEYFHKLGFVQINPASIVSESTEGGADLYEVKYFEQKAYLVQSPQLYKQMAVISGLEKVFMITPVWRAEKHNTTRHLNESRQCDIEVAFADNNDAIKYMSNFMIYLLKTIKKECAEELKLLNVEIKIPQKIEIITYEQACKLIGKKIGEDLSSEDEKKLGAKYDIVFVKDYPTNSRAFYSMPYENRPEYCKSYDLIYNGAEVLSGAQRIHNPSLLERQIKSKGLDPKGFKFYIDAFRYGAPPHAGWSFGLERMTMQMLKLDNIREAVLFPRDRTRLTP